MIPRCTMTVMDDSKTGDASLHTICANFGGVYLQAQRFATLCPVFCRSISAVLPQMPDTHHISKLQKMGIIMYAL